MTREYIHTACARNNNNHNHNHNHNHNQPDPAPPRSQVLLSYPENSFPITIARTAQTYVALFSYPVVAYPTATSFANLISSVSCGRLKIATTIDVDTRGESPFVREVRL